MKIGIVSCYDNFNYGSMLQAYATQVFFDQLDVENEIINYTPFNKKDKFFVKFRSLFFVRTWKKQIDKILNKGDKNKKKFDRKPFEEFLNEYRNVSQIYHSYSDLKKKCDKNYSHLVVGSDQMWHPANIPMRFNFLSFSKTEKKYSFSTSIGVEKLYFTERLYMKKMLKKFKQISVRETSAKKIIDNLIEKKSIVLPDPTLCIEKKVWDDFAAKKIIDEEYIFCYFLGNNRWQREMIVKYAVEKKMKIFALDEFDYGKEISFYKLQNIGPKEFVSLIKNSHCVFTDSFHGTVFSCIFNKNFNCFYRFNQKDSKSTNTRIDNILNNFGLKERLIKNSDDLLMQGHIEFEKVNEIINEGIKRAKGYFVDSFYGDTNE